MAEHRMSDAPTRADVDEARGVERAVAERTYQVAADRLPRQVQGVARTEATKVSRRYGVIALAIAFIVPILFSVAAYSTATDARDVATANAETIDMALVRLDRANDTLTARGQAPVPAPVQADDPTEAIAAAVLAQVLAALPQSPTADDVAARIQTAVVAQVLGPTTDELTRQVAVYFEENPPMPGPPPTQQQIDAAVGRALAADPPAPGMDGRDGQSPACLSEPGMCRGVDGADGDDGVDGVDGTAGAPGRSVVSGPAPVRLDDGDCVWRVEYSAEPLTEEFPAGDAACPGGGLIGLRR